MKYGAFYLVQKANNVYIRMRTDFLCNLPVRVIGSNFKMVTAAVVYGFQLQNQNYRSHKHLTPYNMKEDKIFNYFVCIAYCYPVWDG